MKKREDFITMQQALVLVYTIKDKEVEHAVGVPNTTEGKQKLQQWLTDNHLHNQETIVYVVDDITLSELTPVNPEVINQSSGRAHTFKDGIILSILGKPSIPPGMISYGNGAYSHNSKEAVQTIDY